MIDAFPEIILVLNGTNFVLNKTILFEVYGSFCYFNLFVKARDSNQWILGIPFLNAFFSFFDYDNKSITLYSHIPFLPIEKNNTYIFYFLSFLNLALLFHLFFLTFVYSQFKKMPFS